MLTSLAIQGQSGYSVTRVLYTRENGLPSNDVFCGVQDQRGYTWFGTRNGLCRFNGSRFELVSPPTGELKVWNIESLVPIGKENIIITYANTTQTKRQRKRCIINTITLEQGKMGDYLPHMPFADSSIVAVYKARNGDVGFIVNHPNQVWHYNETCGFRECFTGNRTFKRWPLSGYTSLEIFEQNNFIYMESRGLRSLLISRDTVFTLPWRTHSLVAPLSDGALLYKYDSLSGKVKGFYKWSQRGIYSASVFTGGLPNQHTVSELSMFNCCNNNSSTILQFNGGDAMLCNSGYGSFGVFDNLVQGSFRPAIYNYFCDNRGLYWVCTSMGLVKIRITRQRFRKHYSQNAAFRVNNPSVRGIYANDSLFCANLFDMTVIESGRETLRINKTHNHALLYADSGLWIGAYYLRFYDFRKKKDEQKILSLSNEIWSIYPIRNNKLLLGCTGNLDVYDVASNTLRPCVNNYFPRPVFVYRIFNAPGDKIWAAAENGIFVVTAEGEIVDYFGSEAREKDHLLPFASIRDVYFDKEKQCWIATNGEGLCKWDRRKHEFEYYDITRDFPSNVTYCIQEDDYGNLWISTDYGLVKFNKKNRFIKTYTIKDGIADNEFNRASQFRSSRGLIYFGGVNGITSFDPADFAADTEKVNYPFYVTRCTLFNKDRNIAQNVTGLVTHEHHLTISPEVSSVNLSFALLDYEDRLHQYAYMLEGADNKWNYLTDNELRLANLPFGTHRLLLKAKTSSGYWNRHLISIVLTVVPPYYKTWWFFVLVFLVALAMAGLAIYLRLRQQVKHIKTLGELRVKLASDLHDEVGGLLNKTAMQAEMAKTRSGENTQVLLERIAANCRNAMGSMRDIMWNLDARNDAAISLADRINEYCMDMLGDRFDYTVRTPGAESAMLHPEIRQAVYLVCKEAIHNIVKHAAGSKVEVLLEIKRSSVRLVVFNDGPFVEKAVVTGQGIRNMKMRVEKNKGRFSMETGAGVKIIAVIPL